MQRRTNTLPLVQHPHRENICINITHPSTISTRPTTSILTRTTITTHSPSSLVEQFPRLYFTQPIPGRLNGTSTPLLSIVQTFQKRRGWAKDRDNLLWFHPRFSFQLAHATRRSVALRSCTALVLPLACADGSACRVHEVNHCCLTSET
jgi:hypothetical protein